MKSSNDFKIKKNYDILKSNNVNIAISEVKLSIYQLLITINDKYFCLKSNK